MPRVERRVSVVGLGRLGLPLAACAASRGFHVIGVDRDAEKVRSLERGLSSIHEADLEEALRAGAERIEATSDLDLAVAGSEMTFVLVPTPSEPGGNFSLDAVASVCQGIGRALEKKSDFHLVVVTSTVSPGSTGGSLREVLEIESGKRCGYDFGLCYSPEFVALGSVIRDLLQPDFVLIGESDARSGRLLEDFYAQLCQNQPSVARMNFVNAELTKLAINGFVTAKISFANMLARICEELPEADIDVVSDALGRDSRIGRSYLTGAIAYGGPCFPRDNAALVALGRSLGVATHVPEATDRANRMEAETLRRRVEAVLPEGGSVSILGLAYKPDTDVGESPGISLARDLVERGARVSAYDPAATPGARAALADLPGVRFAESAEACIDAGDVVVVTVAWDEFRNIGADRLARAGRPRTLIDCWRILDRPDVRSSVDYIALGRGPRPAALKGRHAA